MSKLSAQTISLQFGTRVPSPRRALSLGRVFPLRSSAVAQPLRPRLTRAFSTRIESIIVMAGLVPAIHVFGCSEQDVDARRKAGQDGGEIGASELEML